MPSGRAAGGGCSRDPVIDTVTVTSPLVRTRPSQGARGNTPSSRRALVLVVLVFAIVGVSLIAIASKLFGPSRNDTSPVNLSTQVDMAQGLAHQSAIVRLGGARIEVLSPTLLRLEYSPSGNFEDSPT